jgi:hypothetical protein
VGEREREGDGARCTQKGQRHDNRNSFRVQALAPREVNPLVPTPVTPRYFT